MKILKKLVCLCLILIAPTLSYAYQIRGRADVSFLGMSISHLIDNKTANKSNVYGSRVDATIVPFEGYGIAFKPMALYATGDGDLLQGGIQIAHYTPINDCITLVPGIGYTYSDLRSKIKIQLPNVGPFTFNQKVDSNIIFCACDVYYKIDEQWMLTGVFQYGWARSHSKIHSMDVFGTNIVEEGSSDGPSFAGIVDYYITKSWSISTAVGYSKTLSKERHGLKALGYKVGLGYLF